MVATIFAQFYFCYLVSVIAMPRWAYVLIVFAVSGTLNHSLFSALHEASHRTVFGGKMASEMLSIAITLPMGVPAAM